VFVNDAVIMNVRSIGAVLMRGARGFGETVHGVCTMCERHSRMWRKHAKGVEGDKNHRHFSSNLETRSAHMQPGASRKV
jgi:hypothetical protein